MAKTCYVIMPYTGRDGTKREHYLGVYRGIIEPAARMAGYEVIRSDLQNSPGSITNDIIHSLADADMVIADLTEANPNVFLELGIRHVLRKSGTVHIIDQSHDIPFDVKNYRVVEYSTDLARLNEAIQRIAEAIHKREEEPNRSDNPVHDVLTTLPVDIRQIGDASLRERIRQLQATVEELSNVRTDLEYKLSLVDPEYATRSFDGNMLDIDSILLEADEITASSGELALLRLIEAQEKGGKEAFIRELKIVLKSPNLTDSDYLQIHRMTRQLGLDAYSRATLEIARSRYASNTSILLSLVGEYYRAPNPDLRARGRLMIEKHLRIEHTPDGPIFTGEKTDNTISGVGTLFDYYFREDKYHWVVSLVDSLEKVAGPHVIYVRNKARALHKMRQNEAAENEFQRALSIAPQDDTTYAFYADFLDDLARFDDAYEAYEQAIVHDPNDSNRFRSLANHIMLRGYLRDNEYKLMGPVPKAVRVKHALPLYMRAIEISPGTSNQIIRDMIVHEMEQEAQRLAQGNFDVHDFEVSSLQYVERLVANSQAT